MEILITDVAIVGAGGAGLRAAIEIAEKFPDMEVCLISKVYPMRSHTVAAEGGAAGVFESHDSYEQHFNDTLNSGGMLCDQDVVKFFVEQAPKQLIQLENWGCPWSRRLDGSIDIRRFGGMSIERTWFASDRSGFHILHTLFQTSIKYKRIKRLDEHFVLELLVDGQHVSGVLCVDIGNRKVKLIQAKSIIIATGGASRVFHHNSNSGIVTGDGMALAYRNGVALRDMEFVQYHPTGLPGSGILITEGCRGDGGVLRNKDGYRYLQDYGLGPETPLGSHKNKFMELGSRDCLSQCFWQEASRDRTIKGPYGDFVNLDLTHLGASCLHKRLPFICELTKTYLGIDPVIDPIPVRPTVHYTMGGIETNIRCGTSLLGLFAAGECASIGLHGANRLGSNSLSELLVFGQVSGEEAAQHAAGCSHGSFKLLEQQAQNALEIYLSKKTAKGTERLVDIRNELGLSMEKGVGIYRTAETMQQTINEIAELKQRYNFIRLDDNSTTFNTERLIFIELGFMLDIAEAMAVSAFNRKESRGSHQRTDGFNKRDDVNFFKYTRAHYQATKQPIISHCPINKIR